MPTIQAEVYEIIKRKLESEQKVLRGDIDANRHRMRMLENDSTLKKRELAVLGDLIRSMNQGATTPDHKRTPCQHPSQDVTSD